MNVLWINNLPVPPVCEYLHLKHMPKEGWVYSSLKRLAEHSDEMRIAVATVYNGNEFHDFEKDGIRYFCLPLKGKSVSERLPHLQPYWREVSSSFRPDVIHIHGSEFMHGYEWCEANGYDRVVVSFQGMVSGIERYYAGGMRPNFIKNITFRDFIKREWLSRQLKRWHWRAEEEKKFLAKVPNYIGRTEWDKAHGWAINPDARYFYCGETLRDSFYTNRWSYEKCVPHTIFASQGSYPLKGVDMIIKALPLIKKHYPDVKLRVAGGNIMDLPFYRISGYGKYLKNLCAELDVKENVTYTGMLSEDKMLHEYQNANVFVCSSSIENSPNSLAEAQILGMPYLTTFVGGTPDLTGYNEKVLYRFEEYEMLASKICAIFAESDKFNPHPVDKSRYDGEKNINLLIDIYREISKC